MAASGNFYANSLVSRVRALPVIFPSRSGALEAVDNNFVGQEELVRRREVIILLGGITTLPFAARAEEGMANIAILNFQQRWGTRG
jgi:hypothetical protein